MYTVPYTVDKINPRLSYQVVDDVYCSSPHLHQTIFAYHSMHTSPTELNLPPVVSFHKLANGHGVGQPRDDPADLSCVMAAAAHGAC